MNQSIAPVDLVTEPTDHDPVDHLPTDPPPASAASRFFKLPVHWTAEDNLRRMSAGTLRVLMALVRYADARGVCWPGRTTLCRVTGLGMTTVYHAIRQLREMGVLNILETGSGRRSSRYQLQLHQIPSMLIPTQKRSPIPLDEPHPISPMNFTPSANRCQTRNKKLEFNNKSPLRSSDRDHALAAAPGNDVVVAGGVMLSGKITADEVRRLIDPIDDASKENSDASDDRVTLLTTAGIDVFTANRLVRATNPSIERTRQVIAHAQSSQQTRNAAGFIVLAIERNWTVPETRKSMSRELVREKIDAAIAETSRQLRDERKRSQDIQSQIAHVRTTHSPTSLQDKFDRWQQTLPEELRPMYASKSPEMVRSFLLTLACENAGASANS